MAWRCARELQPGIVNLGIGIPIYVPDYLPAGRITLHSENGILGVGPSPAPGQEDPDLVNASKLPVTELPYTSFFDSSWSFAMMRGGHLDATVVGALQVAENGDLASWAIPGQDVLGVGGVMDLVIGAKHVIVAMTHVSAKGEPKIVQQCTYPLTASRRVGTIVTEYAVFKIAVGRLQLVELIEEMSLDELKSITPARYDIAEALARPRQADAVPFLKN
ncbi:3-oxoacid CoA-transferase subunit B [Paenibacillus koleovorans]|uniref:3-oxoacid CoA-transferase subunit B n=1 Tax=Paenibacillus koleovorans TaxID=121608 RepID=UPI0027D8FFFD|nr:3-oxoacid CoA-transferase subunit B [Paenibacillus koleovorans]